MTFPAPEMTSHQTPFAAAPVMDMAGNASQDNGLQQNVHIWPVASPFPGSKTMLMVNGQLLMHDCDYFDENASWPAPFGGSASSQTAHHGYQDGWHAKAEWELHAEWDEPSYLSASASRRRRRQRAKQGRNIKDQDDENRTTGGEYDQRQLSEFAASMLLRLKSGDQTEVAVAVAELEGAVLALSFDATGTRVVQLALEKADRMRASLLARELRGHVRRAIRCPQANYVVQKIVEVLPAKDSSFIAEELLGCGAQATRHAFGCRVICRFLEHSLSDPTMLALMQEVLAQAGELCRHAYGHHVMEHFLEHGQAEHKATIARALLQDLDKNARNRQATYVIEKALENAAPQDVLALETALVSDSRSILELAENQFGCHVVRTLLRQGSDASRLTQQILSMEAPRLKETKFGAKVVEELESLVR